MAEQTLRIENMTNGYTFLFKHCQDTEDDITNGVIKAPLVNVGWQNTPLFKFGGQVRSVMLSFVLLTETTDLSEGTYTSTVMTVDDQMAYLQREIDTGGFSDYHRLSGPTGTPLLQTFAIEDGVLENLNLKLTRGSLNIATGTFTFTFGLVNLAG